LSKRRSLQDVRYLLDVNVLIAVLDVAHVHHRRVTKWFSSPGLQWAVSPFTEAGFFRYMLNPRLGDVSAEEATAILLDLTKEPGYHYQPISSDWQTLTKPFFERLFGHKQITDAYLLGLAIREGMVLATFDKAILHMAGEHSSHVLLLTE
jgi:toxin-antitoxin system PIN domain toxin